MKNFVNKVVNKSVNNFLVKNYAKFKKITIIQYFQMIKKIKNVNKSVNKSVNKCVDKMFIKLLISFY